MAIGRRKMTLRIIVIICITFIVLAAIVPFLPYILNTDPTVTQ